jgi:hypothetical protein
MTSTQALADGIRRVNSAPVILVCVFVVTVLTALPFSIAMRDVLATHLGSSMAAAEAARGVNYVWWTEFTGQADELGKTFTTAVIGFAAVLDNLSTLLDRDSRPVAILWLGAFYLVLWLFLAGGILDRYARGRPTRSYEFFTACGVYFVRFLRLAPIIAATYYILFAYVHPLLLGSLYEQLTRDVTAERTAFAWRLALYVAFGVCLILTNMVFDYAKVRAVVEDRRSMIGAVSAGVRFVRRNFQDVAALYLLNGMLFVGVLLLYAVVAPGAGATLWLGFAVSQLYLLGRLWVRLVFFAAETSLFQGRLAHAGYIARAPVPVPEPPIVEQIAGISQSGITNPAPPRVSESDALRRGSPKPVARNADDREGGESRA